MCMFLSDSSYLSVVQMSSQRGGVSKAREEEARDKERPPCLRHGFQEGAGRTPGRQAGTIKSSQSPDLRRRNLQTPELAGPGG